MAELSTGKVVAGIAAALLVGGGLVAYTFEGGPNDFPPLGAEQVVSTEEADKEKAEAKAEVAKEKADIKVEGEEVKNVREDIALNANEFCRKNSKLPAGEGKEDKGGTCVSTVLGEIAKNPILVALPDAPTVIAEGKETTFKILVEDKSGPLDLNAFTNIKGKAAETFLEHPGELDADGRPLLHAHLGVVTLKSKQGLPVGNTYDAAFSGVQGVKGNLTAKVGGLKAGFYRADVYTGGPGHAPPPTAKADQVQGFASIYFEVK